MKKLILFDPSYATSNLGDFIINEAVMRHMADVFSHNFLLRYPTHTPLLHGYQNIRDNVIRRNCRESELKFLGGTNIFKKNLFILTPDWNINFFTKNLYKGSIAMGCGMANNSNSLNLYTKLIYKSVLSSEYTHSVRDEKTREFLESMGFRAINTGCPTTWDLTEDHCALIPREKASRVVFTLTDYDRDLEKDQILVDTLLQNYEEVNFWIQGTDDLEYFKSLENVDDIKLVDPSLEAYANILTSGDIDYVGTRLHAGIFAMQKKVRSVIIIVDNRARDMQATYNINAIERDDIKSLSGLINGEIVTKVNIKKANIKKWKSQFNIVE